MKRELLEELACGYISDLVDQLVVLQEKGDEETMLLVHKKIQDLTRAMDSDDATDNFFYVTDHKYLDQ